MHKFTQLGRILSFTIVTSDKVNTRLAKPSAVFDRLNMNGLNKICITGDKDQCTKPYFATHCPNGCEIWADYLFHLHRKKFSTLSSKIRFLTQVFSCAELPSSHMCLIRCQLHWTVHVVRIPDYRLPKKLICSELQHDKCF